jgi:hypothetical protein
VSASKSHHCANTNVGGNLHRTMTRYKKDLPLTVLQTLEPLINEKSKLFKIGDAGKDLLRIDDADPRSTFYFKVVSYLEQGEKLNIEFKPMNGNNVDVYKGTIRLDGLKGQFSNWKSYLTAYESIKIFDDPILRQYQEEFETEIHIVDKDADYNTYDFKTQLWLEEYLTKYSEKIEEFKTPENESEIIDIQADIVDLKNKQTRLTKRKVVEQLSKIWAKTRKIGLGLLKDVYETVKTELINRLITGRLDDLTKLM